LLRVQTIELHNDQGTPQKPGTTMIIDELIGQGQNMHQCCNSDIVPFEQATIKIISGVDENLQSKLYPNWMP
jgi:hypothetical protein